MAFYREQDVVTITANLAPCNIMALLYGGFSRVKQICIKVGVKNIIDDFLKMDGVRSNLLKKKDRIRSISRSIAFDTVSSFVQAMEMFLEFAEAIWGEEW